MLNCTEKTRNIFTKFFNIVERSPDERTSGITYWSSEEEHRADALALGAEEGRDKLR